MTVGIRIKDVVLLTKRVVRAWQRQPLSVFSKLVVHNLKLLLTGQYSTQNAAFDRSFDRRCMVDTAGTEELEYLTAEAALKRHGNRYEPVKPNDLRVLVGMLPTLAIGEFDFVDLGSGKGRALFVAAEFPFKRCIGVEFAQELHEVAVHNIRSYRSEARRCSDIRSVHADAATFEFPLHPIVCFVNNPFGEALIAQMARRFDESVRSVPRPCFLIYLHANYPRSIDALANWSRLAVGSLGPAPYVIWRFDR
ncbi:MAG: hypothetical protein M3Y67_03195 [Pseudomonadota bacterium]|nr:hypothetical protein [Pseudomonadota bacterium]